MRRGTRVLERKEGQLAQEWPMFTVKAGGFIWEGEWDQEDYLYVFMDAREPQAALQLQSDERVRIAFRPLAWEKQYVIPPPSEGWYRVSIGQRHILTGRSGLLNGLPYPPDRRSQLEYKKYVKAGTHAQAQAIFEAELPTVWTYFLDCLQQTADIAQRELDRFTHVPEPVREPRTVITGDAHGGG